MLMKIAVGMMDLHFRENADITIKNIMEGRPVFEGHLLPTWISDPRWPGQRFIEINMSASGQLGLKGKR